MSSQELNTLMDMGFERSRAERALELTGFQGVETAMEWLLAHSDEPLEPSTTTQIPTVGPSQSTEVKADAVAVADANADANADAGAVNEGTSDNNPEEGLEGGSSVLTEDASSQTKSLKCDECGKIFKSQLEIEYHAAKSNHSNFSESSEEKTPLTEDEKKDLLKKLEEKMRAKRVEREEKEKRDALEREKMRIRSGKEMVAVKKKLEEQEMKKLVEQRKKEKLEEKLARQRVKEQIEQDKIARKAKFGIPSSPEPQSSLLELAKERSIPTSSNVSRNYTDTKLQIRLTNGQCLTQTFGSKEQLSAVRLYVEMNRTDGNAPFFFMTNFPKKIFSDEDYDKPLDVLGLVPSAVLIVSKSSGNVH